MDLYGLPATELAKAAGVSLDSARRWKRTGRIPRTPARLVAFLLRGDLGALDPAWRGFVLSGGKLWTPYEFAVSPGEICAIPYHRALIVALERERRTPTQWDLFAEPSQPPIAIDHAERSRRSPARWWRGAKPWQQR